MFSSVKFIEYIIKRIAGSDIAVIHKVKKQIFISCCQPVVKCAGSFCNNNYYFMPHSTLHLPLDMHLPRFSVAVGGPTDNYYYFCRNNTNINMAENKKAKRHNYQGGEKSSYIEIFKWFIYLYTDKSEFVVDRNDFKKRI